MANPLKMTAVQSILSLHAQHWSHRRIAAMLGIDRGAVGRYIRQALSAAQSDQAGISKPAIAPIDPARVTADSKPAIRRSGAWWRPCPPNRPWRRPTSHPPGGRATPRRGGTSFLPSMSKGSRPSRRLSGDQARIHGPISLDLRRGPRLPARRSVGWPTPYSPTPAKPELRSILPGFRRRNHQRGVRTAAQRSAGVGGGWL